MPGALFFAGAIYVWGGLGLNPEGVVSAVSAANSADAFKMLADYYLVGTGSVILGIIAWTVMGLKFDFSLFKKNGIVIAFLILSLTSFSPNLLSPGFIGVSLSLLVVLQNFFGLVGLFLLADGLGILIAGKIATPRLGKEKGIAWKLPICGMLFLLLTAAVGKIILGGIPHVGDAVVQLWQARMYAMGRFFVPPPEIIEFFFEALLAVSDGRWFSQYPPGFALMMVPGVLAGHPELVNPLISGLTLILFGLVLREVGASTRWILLFALSPFVIFMSGAFMSHPASMFWGALGIWAFLKSGRIKPGWLLLWGMAAGLMFSVRPYTCLCFNLPLAMIIFRKRIGLGALTAAAGFFIGALPFFIVNHAVSGSFFTAGYQLAWDGASGLFFGDSQWGPQHTPQFGALHLIILVQGLNNMLFETPIPALIGVALWLLFDRRKGWKEWGLFTAGVLSFAGYYFYFYVDFVYGPRFAYSAAFPILIISALGFKSFYRCLRDRGKSKAETTWSFIVAGVIVLSCWLAISLPARASLYRNRYFDVGTDFIQKIKSEGVENAIVFLDDYPSADRHARLFSLGFTNRQAWYYAWKLSDRAVIGALASLGVKPEDGFGNVAPLPEIGRALNQYWNDPRFIPHPIEDMIHPFIPITQGFVYMSPLINENDIIYARDLGKHNQTLINKYPDRNYYRLTRLKHGLKLEKIEIKHNN